MCGSVCSEGFDQTEEETPLTAAIRDRNKQLAHNLVLDTERHTPLPRLDLDIFKKNLLDANPAILEVPDDTPTEPANQQRGIYPPFPEDPEIGLLSLFPTCSYRAQHAGAAP